MGVGAAPLMQDVEAVRAIKDKAALAEFMGRSTGTFGISLVGTDISSDPNFPDRTVLSVGQDGVGLPDRDYYLKDGFKKQRDAYAAYVERTFKLIGDPDPGGSAQAVIAFETAAATARRVSAHPPSAGEKRENASPPVLSSAAAAPASSQATMAARRAREDGPPWGESEHASGTPRPPRAARRRRVARLP